MHFSDDQYLGVMVKILSTGEIVQDDDPRAQQGGAGRGGTSARPRQVLVCSVIRIVQTRCKTLGHKLSAKWIENIQETSVQEFDTALNLNSN